MAIDQMMLGPMLDTFKKMANDCTEQGHSGEAYDKMMAALNRMEQLGNEMDDFMEFNAKMASEGLQMNFSTAYGEVLSNAAGAEQKGNTEDYDDNALLVQSVNALKDAVQRLKDSETDMIAEAQKGYNNDSDKKMAENEVLTLSKNKQLIKPIEDLIALGESGINFPTFLRVQIEKGLDKAMEGSASLREGIEYTRDFYVASAPNPYDIKVREEELTQFDELADKAKFNVPDSFQMSLEFDNIAQHYAPSISKWNGITRAWERIISHIDTWALAHTSFAPFIEPWSLASNPKEAVQSTKDCSPGEIKEMIRIFNENYNLSFKDIFTHETFTWQVTHFQLGDSQEFIEYLVNKVFPQCNPNQFLTQESTTEMEKFYNDKKMSNPENYKMIEIQKANYDKYFGEGAYDAKSKAKADWGERNAAPWNLDSFTIN